MVANTTSFAFGMKRTIYFTATKRRQIHSPRRTGTKWCLSLTSIPTYHLRYRSTQAPRSLEREGDRHRAPVCEEGSDGIAQGSRGVFRNRREPRRHTVVQDRGMVHRCDDGHRNVLLVGQQAVRDLHVDQINVVAVRIGRVASNCWFTKLKAPVVGSIWNFVASAPPTIL